MAIHNRQASAICEVGWANWRTSARRERRAEPDGPNSGPLPQRAKRWTHEAVIDAMQKRLDMLPNGMGIRRRTVEHVFGTLKSWMESI